MSEFDDEAVFDDEVDDFEPQENTGFEGMIDRVMKRPEQKLYPSMNDLLD